MSNKQPIEAIFKSIVPIDNRSLSFKVVLTVHTGPVACHDREIILYLGVEAGRKILAALKDGDLETYTPPPTPDNEMDD